VEHHGIVVTECITENVSDYRMCHFRNVMEKSSWMVSWNATPEERHGKASWKAILVERHGKASRKASWKQRGAQRKHQRSQNVPLSECHGKVVMDSVMESNTCATSWKGVTEITICLASRKTCHGKLVTESVMETARCAASWKGVMESDTGGASRRSRHGMRHGKHDPSSVTEKASLKASWEV